MKSFSHSALCIVLLFGLLSGAFSGVLHLLHPVEAQITYECNLFDDFLEVDRQSIKVLKPGTKVYLLSFVYDESWLARDKAGTRLPTGGIYWGAFSGKDTGFVTTENVGCNSYCSAELKSTWQHYDDSIKAAIDSAIAFSKHMDSVNQAQQDSLNFLMKSPATLTIESILLRDKPLETGKPVLRLIRGDIIFIQNAKNGWSNIKFKFIDSLISGWLPSTSFFCDSTAKDTLPTEIKLRRNYVRINYLKLGKYKSDILNGTIRLGMNNEMVRIVYGVPDKINRTVSTSGVHEQWVYGDEYFYFDNNILTSWQD